jgi:hypothetical protein
VNDVQQTIPTITDLSVAMDGSYYFIAGAGGDLNEWVEGYAKMMHEWEAGDIGEPCEWFQTTGAAVNHFAEHGGHDVADRDHFPDDITCLLFPLDGLNMSLLPIFKIAMEDRWFDDVIQNMRRS